VMVTPETIANTNNNFLMLMFFKPVTAFIAGI
jgi:hypothetical protein